MASVGSRIHRFRWFPLLAWFALFTPHAIGAAEPKLELNPGDHICIIGNTLADRMQHTGWLETFLHSRFPKHDLVIRNLGFSADELQLKNRLRSMDFGSPDQWLSASAPVPQPRKLTHNNPVLANRFEHAATKADVIFAFFGYNESFAGEAGLPEFKKDLQAFITHTLAQKYNGKSAPRLVLFSPIAHENLKSPHLPDGVENNKRLALYTATMAEVAAQNKIPFVDLFKPSQDLYSRTDKPLTVNGIHLTDSGYKQLAEVMDAALFGAAQKLDPTALEKLRVAVADKNFYWFNRYRTLDGFSIYGDRAFIEFGPDRQSNYEVMQRELEILDLMTSNRDKRIWTVAQGGDAPIDDTKLPPQFPVKTNFPGKLPGGKHLFLDPEEAIQKMIVAKGFKVDLFASEKQFPELTNAVQMSWDTQGRLWVAVWPSYPHWKPGDPMNDKLLILEDTDGDGRADKCTVFADGLHCPTGFEFVHGGVLVAQAPDIMFLKDTEGKGKATLRQRVVHGIDSADTHHTSNSFVLDPGGAVYFQEGTFHHTQVETPYGPAERCVNAGVFRYDPRRQKFEVYVSYGFANPHGHVFDRWGQDIVVDGTGSDPYHAALFSGRMEHPNKHSRTPTVYPRWARPCPGMEYMSSKHFPEEFNGNLLVADVIQARGILMYKIQDDGGSLKGTEVDLGLHRNTLLTSTDPNFRPSDLKIGPDGALYFLDWHNPIIGHLQHNLRDPSRDHEHGRIYRLTAVGRPLEKPIPIAGATLEKLFDLLKSPEDRVRYRTRIELGGREADAVLAGVKKWVETLDKKDADYEHHLLEALWVHQHQDYVNTDLLKRVLVSPDFRARAAATRVLCYWRESIPDAPEMLLKCAADEHPRVRLEAVRAASFFKDPAAVEVVLVAAEKPFDAYVDFVSKESMRTIDPIFQKAIADKKRVNFKSAAGIRYFYKTVGTEELLKLEKNAGVYLEMLFRKGIRDENRREALAGLAKIDKKPELKVLIDSLKMQDETSSAQDESVLFDLVRLMTSRPASELQAFRADLEKFATTAKMPVMRQLGYVAMIAVDGGIDKAWELAGKSVASLTDLLNAMPMIRDPGRRADLYPKVEPLLDGLPKGLATNAGQGKTVVGRYVRVELPGNGKTLTLAEVEVYGNGKNVARQGKATQSSTAHGGEASRAIDGNKSGSFSNNGQTHTAENTKNPWWEVDLGSDMPITSVAIYNRTDDGLGQRLKDFTLKVLDGKKQVVFQKAKIPAPTEKVVLEIGSDSPDRLVRRAAMAALVTVRGQEESAFKALARFIKDSPDRDVALASLLRIPSSHWPKAEAAALMDVILGYIRNLPAAERTSPVAVDAMQLGDNLAALLPIEEARKIRKELGELSIRVLRVGTLPEQMAYDKERLIVQAGKPFEILLDNADLMPHNFVITTPGAMAEIGQQAEADATKPGAADRQYVPASNKVLLASRLIQPRESQRLAWVAPKTAGVYPYVCTYPGHWRRMYGSLYVVDSLEDYQADPEAYLVKHPLPIQDELLKFNRPRKEWKFDDLAGEVTKLEGRSFANGKQLFKVGACISCHKVGGEGQDFGPDLMKLDMKIDNPTEILRHILEPSLKIDDKYRMWKIETSAGKSFTGMILEETKQAIKLIENPLAKADAITVKLDDVERRAKSDVSMMPKGLLDKFTKDEILDLIAYIASKANAQHKYFQGGHEHHH